MTVCGHPTRRGAACRLNSPCPTHDCDLAARNAKVRASFAAGRPDDYRAHQAAAGSGAQAVCRVRYGEHYAQRRLAAWRRKHPTGLERIVTGWLDQAWLAYATECELVPGRAFADIVVRTADGAQLAVECDSLTFHSVHPYHGEDRPAHDRERDEQVTAAGFRLLRLPERDIASGAGRAVLSEAIGVRL